MAWVAALAAWIIVWALVFFTPRASIWITKRDLDLMQPIVDHRAAWATPTMRAINRIGTHWATPVIGWVTIAGALFTRRLRHVLLLMASLMAVTLTVAVLTNVEINGSRLLRPRPLGMTRIGDWDGFSQPSRVCGLLAATLIATGLTLVPAGSWRRRWWTASAIAFAIFAYAQLYTGVEHPTDILAGATVGIALTMVLFRVLAPETVFPITYRGGNTAHLDIGGVRGDAIRRGLRDQLGMDVAKIDPIGLDSSAGSTPLKISAERDGEQLQLFGKLYARSHLRSDRSYKLFRTIRYGRLEDETRYASVRRLVQHEHYMLHLLKAAGITSANPVGVVEITPEREYLLVTEFLQDAVEIDQAEWSDQLVDDGLAIVESLWRAGLAHRDIKPANVMVAGGRVHLIDVAFAQLRPSPWRQAVDLANMMLVLALRSSPELVYEAALRRFSVDDIAEAFAASRGVTVPSALRSGLRSDGRPLLERFRTLAPDRKRVQIQRWSLRRIGVTAWVGLLVTLSIGLIVGSLGTLGLTPSARTPDGTTRPPWCDRPGSALLSAQSVPAAMVLPCVGTLPDAWAASDTRVDQNGTTVRFESELHGDKAVLRIRDTCDLDGTAPRPSRDPLISRYVSYPAGPTPFPNWFSVAPGACWWWEFDFAGSPVTERAHELDRSLRTFTRAELNADLQETFIDEDA